MRKLENGDIIEYDGCLGIVYNSYLGGYWLRGEHKAFTMSSNPIEFTSMFDNRVKFITRSRLGKLIFGPYEKI